MSINVLPCFRQTESENFWRQGGQTVQATNNSVGVGLLPNDTINDVEFIGTGHGTVAELVSTIHSSLDTKLNNVMEQLSGIANHTTSLEMRQQTLEQEGQTFHYFVVQSRWIRQQWQC